VADLAIGDLRDDEIDAAVVLWGEAGLTRPWNDSQTDARLGSVVSYWIPKSGIE
jgi:hypothetical protein